MAFWTDLHRKKHLITRTFYRTGATVTAPARSAYVRVSMVGAGGWDAGAGAPGYGAAFARVKTACTPAETFALQVGDTAHTVGAGDALGDSIFTRNTGAVVLCKAKRGTSTAAGAAAGCVGDTKRSGFAPFVGVIGSDFTNTARGGASGSDDGDTFELGIGGRGGGQFIAAAPGGGGFNPMTIHGDTQIDQIQIPPGDGFACVEFFDRDPTISWPGYGG